MEAIRRQEQRDHQHRRALEKSIQEEKDRQKPQKNIKLFKKNFSLKKIHSGTINESEFSHMMQTHDKFEGTEEYAHI